MSDVQLIDWARDALYHAALLSAPLLIVGIVVGIVMGMLQAVTQIHDQSLSFAPKLLIVMAAFSLILPWFMQHLSYYAVRMFSQLPF